MQLFEAGEQPCATSGEHDAGSLGAAGSHWALRQYKASKRAHSNCNRASNTATGSALERETTGLIHQGATQAKWCNSRYGSNASWAPMAQWSAQIGSSAARVRIRTPAGEKSPAGP
jgi:hypothetical protein